jgi:solute carrier family 9 (sodium/hydrogen exchanger), member 6/7
MNSGMIVGLILRLAASNAILSNVSFDYQMFFNLLLPPIILASGYELHQVRFDIKTYVIAYLQWL